MERRIKGRWRYVSAETGEPITEIITDETPTQSGIQHLPVSPQQYQCMGCGEVYTERPGRCVCARCGSIYALPYERRKS